MISENEYHRIYQQLLDRMIEAAKDLYGKLAVKIASRVEKLEVSADGKVAKISGPPEEVLQNLLREYEALGGTMSRNLNEAILKAYRKQYPDINFPAD